MHMLTFIFSFVVMLSALGGINYYISKRIHSGIKAFLTFMPFWPILTVFAILTVVTILGFARSMLPFSKTVKKLLGIVSSYWMGIFVYIIIFIILVDLVALIFKICKFPFVQSSIFKGCSLILVLILTLSTVLYGTHNVKNIKHISYEIELNNKIDVSDLNIIMISDLHLGAVGSEARLENIVSEINSLKPDLVCIAGDFFDSDYDAINNPEKAIETIKKISSTYGIYACLGNHDAGKTYNNMQAFLKKCNVQLLNDSYTVIDGRLVLVGRLDASPIGGYGDMNRKNLKELSIKEAASLPVIVMEHNPANIVEYKNEADLILSGHTHKGQIFPANIVTKLTYEVDYGYYRKNAQSPHVIVTSGVGYWGMPMRVGTNSEIVSIKLKS